MLRTILSLLFGKELKAQQRPSIKMLNHENLCFLPAISTIKNQETDFYFFVISCFDN